MLEFDEIVAVLRRSATPTLIVEGKDDYVSFEEFEIENVSWGLTILPVSGRRNVLRIIGLVNEIRHPALAFLIDRDDSIFDDACFISREDTFFTDGYAIENDLVRDGDIVRLLRPLEREGFERDLAKMARYFSCAVACHVEGREGHPLSYNAYKVLGQDGQLNDPYKEWVASEEGALHPRFAVVREDPLRYIQGKSLMSVFNRYFQKSNRVSKFSTANLLEIGSRARGPLIGQIEAGVLDFFRRRGVAPS